MVVSSPGRLNIIGEHVDYTGGFVLPFAINRRLYIEVERSDRFVFTSEGFKEYRFSRLKKVGDWPDYIIGVIKEFEKLSLKVPPLCFRVRSEIPPGSGLSSSAALETAASLAISQLFNFNLSKRQIFKISLRAEREFVGVNCGIMDQYTAVFAKKEHALLIDTYHETHRYVKMDLKGYTFGVINSNVKHSLAEGHYNKRRKEAEEALKEMGKSSYREVTLDDVENISDPILKKRARHIVTENIRVKKTVHLLEKGKLNELGKLLYESHESLSKNYEVSCEETDFIVEFMKSKGITGARMVGAGFGGGVLVFGEKPKILAAYTELEKFYFKKFGLTPQLLFIDSDDGVRVDP